MIRDGELRKVLTPVELQAFYDIVNKVKDYDSIHSKEGEK